MKGRIVKMENKTSDDIADELWPGLKSVINEFYDEMGVTARLFRYSLLKKSECEKLQLENTVLKEKLEIAESQLSVAESKIEELQSQVAYCENI